MRDKHTEWPDLEHYADIPLFNTRAVAQQTGIAAPTLRAWERRYMILSPQRAQNDYRLYSERDIAIIRWLKAHVDEGMSISQAIALFRHLEEEQGQLHQRTSAPQESSSPATYDLHIVQERLLEAFTKLDEDTASRLMASVLAIYPLEQVCTQLVSPALWEIGRRWEQGLMSVSIEHFASAFFHGLLTNLLHVTPINTTNPLVIICCAPGEEHELAPLMLSLLLRRAGFHVAYLGQSIENVRSFNRQL
jgi:MerR family transcriptional regulator, light-induced transcriptional regulator